MLLLKLEELVLKVLDNLDVVVILFVDDSCDQIVDMLLVGADGIDVVTRTYFQLVITKLSLFFKITCISLSKYSPCTCPITAISMFIMWTMMMNEQITKRVQRIWMWEGLSPLS